MPNSNKKNLQKILIILKNASNESCAELNFLQKTHWKHISIYSRSGARRFQRYAVFELLLMVRNRKVGLF